MATVRLCRWVALPLPELRNGCLPWAGAGGGRAVCRYDTEVPIYKGGLQPAKSTNSTNSTNSAESADSRRRHSRAGGNLVLSVRKLIG
ncbi:hypothetical protein ABWF71_01890 [Neisseria gonorrhoeae]|uniref:hypothetical protein n=1 Tax=Neisseria gonorrhoeae TaxID=485 RepID=UPI0034E93AD1